MNERQRTLRFHSENIHLDTGELVAGEVACHPGEGLELAIGSKTSESLRLPEGAHIALGRFDPHVHFRESALPTCEEFEEHGPAGGDYEALTKAVAQANVAYSIRSGCLAALKGGVCSVGAMGNLPWSPVGAFRQEQTQAHYDAQGLFKVIVWPRMEPGYAAIPGHEGKDFGSTFGGLGLTGSARQAMYEQWRGEAVSFHNDQARPDETIAAFRDRAQADPALLHHEYFDGETVLACQAETLRLAAETGVSSLLARHIPTGPGLQQILDASKTAAFELPAEVGLDYVYWCRERLLEQARDVALINYRRPAHPSRKDQLSLIETTRDAVRSGYPIFFGSDHAPHAPAAKAFRDGLPGSPGTRNIEHSLQYYLELQAKYGYTWADIDRLAAINPAKHMARYFKYPREVGAMVSGAMANLAIFLPAAPYAADESALAAQLEDPHYHTALRGERGLLGKSLFTVADGRVWDVSGAPTPMNF